MSCHKFLPTSTLTIFTILVNQHIVQVTALKQVFKKFLLICSFLLIKATHLCLPCLTFLQHLTQLIIISLYTISMPTLDILILPFNGFHHIRLIVHTTSLNLIIVLLFAPVHSGVPQGSVFGPILFTMYIKPLSAIIDSHSIIHHSFADDLQLQMSAPPDRISELLHSMQSCISDVNDWATASMLKLNDNKTELMLVTSKRTKRLHSLPTSITIGNAQIPFKQSVKNFGLTLDCHLTMIAHVSNIARTCYFELRRLAFRFMTSTATATLVSAFVLSRIHYCSSMLFGSTHDVTSHLQRIQNYAARVILHLPKSSSITIHLKSFHWLPVKVRSTYKIDCSCYHCHSSTAPSYVTDMQHKKPLHTHNTRSSSYTMPLLNRPAHSKATLGDLSFSYASSSAWNSIPNDDICAPSLSSSKSRLKTYLLRSVYKD